MDKPDKIVPANLEAEEAVLGSLLIDPDAIIKIAAFLKSDDFYREKNGWIYQAILDLHERREPADFVTLVDELERKDQLQEVGGVAYVTALINSVPTAVHVEYYARIVERTATLRRLIGAAGQIAGLAYEEAQDVDEVVDRAEQLIFSVSERRVRRDLTPVHTIMSDVVNRIEYLHSHKGDILGVPSGFGRLDKLLGGFQKSDLVILAARPGVGKCIVSGSRLLDPDTGRLVTIDEMVQKQQGQLLTLDEHYRLVTAGPSKFVDDGVKPVYRVRTALGREITTTASHPFLTIAGWRPLAHLSVGERIAAPRALPHFGSREMPEGRIELIAYLLADGCLTHTTPEFTNEDERLRADFVAAAATLPGLTTRLYTSGGTRTPSLHVVGDPAFIDDGRHSFAERLREALPTGRASQRRLAAELEITPALICAWQKGDCVPNAETFARLCAALNVAPELLAPDGLAAISRNSRNPLVLWLSELGVWGKDAHEQTVPAPIFELTRPQVSLFLNRLFACDGSLFLSNGDNPQISYSTVSHALARDVQHLLLRFGIIARLRHKKVRYQDAIRPAYELIILGSSNVLRFLDEIGAFGKEDKASELRAVCGDREANANLDTIPVGIWERILAAKGKRSWRDVYRQLGYPLESNFHVGRRAPGRTRLAELARAFGDQELLELAQSDIYWDTIESIEYVGERQVYDLTVDGTHNFVAEDMLVHNTSLALNVAMNAAKRYGQRVAFFSLEMSAEQLVQRLLSSETGINQQRLRLGDITDEEWLLLMEAASELSETLLFIDDTPAMSALELRTKARRLQAEHGLDMIIVDYLQLMRSDSRSENRVQEISYITRSLKGLAREVEVPLLALSQLSRAVESRSDHRPILSDLRESGCLTGDSLVVMADTGASVPIKELVGTASFNIWALDPDTLTLRSSPVSNAFCTGCKPVYRLTTQLGRTIRATGNHKFRTADGWQRLDELQAGQVVALPRRVPTASAQTMSDAELALLGHLLGDGCTLPRHAIQYTTREEDLAEAVAALATQVFATKVKPRIRRERKWFQVYLASTRHLTYGHHSAVTDWLTKSGIWGLRSYEKRVPEAVFRQPEQAIAVFLRHLWATDGCIRMRYGATVYPAIYYATSSEALARDVQSLLLRLGINARVKRVAQPGKGCDQHHVILGGRTEMLRFADLVGAVGSYKVASLCEVVAFLAECTENTNRDILPKEVWSQYVRPAMRANGVTHRQLHTSLGMAYAGMTLFKQNMSRERAHRVAVAVDSSELDILASSDIYWDRVVSVEADGEEEVYDLTVPGPANFVANDIIVHNSIEQDADIVMFIYREDMVKENSDKKNVAEVIVAKHRNGPTDTVPLFFDKSLTRFADLELTRAPLETA